MNRKNIIAAILLLTMALSCTSAFASTIKETPSNITICDLQTSKTTGISLMSTGNTATYTGSEITPSVEIYDEDNVLLTEGDDYTLSYENNINVGTATINITYKGNYTGTAKVTFEITAKGATEENTTISKIADVVYTGSAMTPEPTIVVDGITLVKGEDYTLSYEDNINAGTATVTVEFKGNYSGELTTTFEITADTLTNDDVVFTVISDQTYTGNVITPEPIITYTSGNVTLVKDVDYTLTYENNVNAGTATVNVEFIGNYSGTASTTFEIVTSEITGTSVTVGDIADCTYNRKEQTPEPDVIMNGVTLTKDVDYTLSYSNNINAGTGTVTITGIGNYSGEITKDFTIKPKSGNMFIVVILDGWQ